MPHFGSGISPLGGGISGRANRRLAQRFNREEEQAAGIVGGFEGQQRRAGFDLADPSFALSSKDVRQARLGNLKQFERQASALFGGQVFRASDRGPTGTFSRNRSRLAQAEAIATTGPGFLAGQGFSLQPLGFNIALSEFQDEEDLFGQRVPGGFLVNTRKLGGKRATFGAPQKTLLSGQIRRRKLTVGGSVIKGPVRAPKSEQPVFRPPSRGTTGQRGRPPPSRAPRRGLGRTLGLGG